MQKSTTLVLCLFALSIAASAALNAQSYSGGSGTSGDPYQISTKADLKYLSENSGEWTKHFKQTANISFESADFESGGDFFNSGNGFIPIGNSTTNFTGRYNGNKFSISNLYISRASSDYVGMFGYAKDSIQNLYLLSVDITGNDYVGGLVGMMWGATTGCYTSGSVTGGYYCGGLLGYTFNSPNITQNGSSCSVTSDGSLVGGLIGQSTQGGSVSDCFATGNVSASNYAGGLVGYYENATIHKCYSTGTVFASGGFYGGITAGENGTFGQVLRTFWDTETSGIGFSAGGTGRTTAQMQTQSTYTDSSWDFSTIWEISASNYPWLQTISINSIIATTDAATSIGTTAATLNGTVTTSGDTSAVRFLYGTTSGVYTDSVTATPDTVKASTATSVSAALTGLMDGTMYFYKVIAQGKSDNTYISGSEKSFTTSSELWGTALTFDSDNSTYAKAGGPASTATDNFTIEAWVKWDGTNTGVVQTIAANGNAGTDGYGVYLYTDTKLAILICAKAWLRSDSVLTAGEWTHVAMVRNSGTWSLYKNGISLTLGGDPPTSPHTPATNFFVGGDSVNYRFNGAIDEVRMSTSVRYTSNFTPPTEPFTSDGNTAALYHLDEGTGTTSTDASGNDNTLNLINSPTWTGSNNPLPVELVAFGAIAEGHSIRLQWKTATEVNNHGFEIEKFSNSRISEFPNSSWKKIGFVDGNGTSNNTHEYSFVDQSFSAGTYSYRLKQIDRDGKYTYSQEVEVTVGQSPNVFALEQNYPNPFNPSTEIRYQLSEVGRVSLKVYDAIGREVKTLVNEVKVAGVYSASFDGSKLSSGIYFAKLQSGEHVQLKKMSLVK